MMTRWKPLVMTVALCIGMMLVLGSCERVPPIPVKNESPYLQTGDPVWGGVDGVVNLSQGWSRNVQQWWWYTSQGTQIIAYDWFLHLEQPDNTESLRSNDNLRDLGYLIQGATSLNPDSLPVGFVKDEADNGTWFGVNCSACHTGQIEYGEHKMRVDGGPTLGNFNALIFVEILGSMEATLNNQAKFDRFAANVLGDNPPQDSLTSLRTRLENRTAFLKQRARYNAAPDSTAGQGRLDAVNNIFNAVWGADLGFDGPPNVDTADAPVSYPALWDAPQTDLVQWAGFVNNKPPGPLTRNLGEVLGVFATFRFHQESQGEGYESSARLTEQGWLEEWLTSLWSPQWPEQYLGEINEADSAAGRALYLTYCITCHSLLTDPERMDENREIAAQMWPVHYVGTDKENAYDFADRAAGLVKTGKIEGRPTAYVLGEPLGPEAAGIDVLAHGQAGIIARQPGQAVVSAVRSAFTMVPEAPPFDPKSYRSRPLNGIWATAPFLHNGSVPNLWELLKPDSLRVKTFYVGSREYDPVDIGYVTTVPDAGVATMVDTSLKGSSNSGHNYGTDLSDEDKRKLIEYIKSL